MIIKNKYLHSQPGKEYETRNKVITDVHLLHILKFIFIFFYCERVQLSFFSQITIMIITHNLAYMKKLLTYKSNNYIKKNALVENNRINKITTA